MSKYCRRNTVEFKEKGIMSKFHKDMVEFQGKEIERLS